MKFALRIAALCLLGLAPLLLVGCEGPEGPAGVSASGECQACHSDEAINAKIIANRQQWETSVHATGGHYVRNTEPCLNCHTNEGFQGLDATTPTPIGCFTCHDPHNKLDFSVRKPAPVNHAVYLSGDGVYNKGKSNLCANCHQARDRAPKIEDFPATPGSIHWGPHHGPQSNILNGDIAYDFGEGAYHNHPYHPNAPNGCVQCHMALPVENGELGLTGGHTWRMEYDGQHNTDGCNVEGCHKLDPLEDFSHNGLQAEIEELLDEIGTLATQAGLLEDGEPIADRTYTKEEIGIVFNYLNIEEDRSMGVHNPTYVEEMLERTLTHVQALAQTASLAD